MMLTGLIPRDVVASISVALSDVASRAIPAGYESVDFSLRVLKFLLSSHHRHGDWMGLRKPK
jgi:hypothetical protein